MRAPLLWLVALALTGCAASMCMEPMPKIPGQDEPLGTFSGTQQLGSPDAEHGRIEFVDGWKEGREQLWYADGTLEKDYTYRHGQPTGKCRSWHEDGKLEREWIIDEAAGTASYKEWSRNGALVRSSFALNGKAEGLFEAWFDDGSKICEGQYHADLKEGPWKCWNSDGSLDLKQSGLYEANKRVGPLPE